jgi:ribosomal protein S18 acetylase RimI-like enzyme
LLPHFPVIQSSAIIKIIPYPTPPKALMLLSRSILLMLILTTIRFHTALTIIIAPPTSALDYQQAASLVVSTFDAPCLNDKQKVDESPQNRFNLFRWNLIDKSLTEDFTYRQYVRTARRMRGKKYCLLLAKEYQDDDSFAAGSYDVVGMVEMGMSPCPKSFSTVDKVTSEVDPYNSQSEVGATTTGDCPQPTIGVLCVKSTHQKQGVGRALVQKCEEIVQEIWKENEIFVDVEPSNRNALLFFRNCGYEYAVDESGTKLMRDTKVFRRRVEEVKPHWLLRKSIGGAGMI